MVMHEHEPGLLKLAQLIQALNPLRLLLGLAERRQQDRGENANNRDHDQ